jgi:hypothetical protein
LTKQASGSLDGVFGAGAAFFIASIIYFILFLCRVVSAAQGNECERTGDLDAGDALYDTEGLKDNTCSTPIDRALTWVHLITSIFALVVTFVYLGAVFYLRMGIKGLCNKNINTAALPPPPNTQGEARLQGREVSQSRRRPMGGRR